MINQFDYKISNFGDYSTVITIIEKNTKKSFLLFFNNCDYVNGVIYFLLNKFNGKIEIPFDCDRNFWNDFLYLYNKENKTNKEFIFIGKNKLISKQKENGKVIMFSGGKESVVSLYLLNKRKIIPKVGVYISPVHPFNLNYLTKNGFLTEEIYKFTSNIDELLYYTEKNYQSDLNVILPILNKYKISFIGVNKRESLLENTFFFYFKDLQLLFEKHGLQVISLVDSMQISDIVEYANKNELKFLKCNGEDYCYKCSECVELFYTLSSNNNDFKPNKDMIKKIKKVNFNTIKENFNDRYFLNYFKEIFNEKNKKHSC